MSWLSDLAHLFLGDEDDSNEQPSEEDLEAAAAADQLMSGEYQDEWNEGVNMGTVPDTPGEYEGEDTDPGHPAVGWNRLLPWNW